MRTNECRLVHGDGVFSLRLGRNPSAMRLVRHGLRRWLERDDIAPEDAFRIALACSEACAHAVEHPVAPARQALGAVATCERGELQTAVRDFGSWDERRRTSIMRGRGLRMIRSLMEGVEIVSSAAGPRVVIQPAATTSDPQRLDNVRYLADYRLELIDGSWE